MSFMRSFCNFVGLYYRNIPLIVGCVLGTLVVNKYSITDITSFAITMVYDCFACLFDLVSKFFGTTAVILVVLVLVYLATLAFGAITNKTIYTLKFLANGAREAERSSSRSYKRPSSSPSPSPSSSQEASHSVSWGGAPVTAHTRVMTAAHGSPLSVSESFDTYAERQQEDERAERARVRRVAELEAKAELVREHERLAREARRAEAKRLQEEEDARLAEVLSRETESPARPSRVSASPSVSRTPARELRTMQDVVNDVSRYYGFVDGRRSNMKHSREQCQKINYVELTPGTARSRKLCGHCYNAMCRENGLTAPAPLTAVVVNYDE
jgi:hypothetical protein